MRTKSVVFILLFLIPMIILIDPANGSFDQEIKIDQQFVYDEQDRNEWGPSLGGEEIGAEWGETVLFKALPMDPIERSVIFIWNVTNLASGKSACYQGKQIEIKFYPSDRRLDVFQREKFLVELTVYYVRSRDIASWSTIQFWVSSDDDNDNDGMPDWREKYYWNDDILHHHPEDDEDEDNWTNIQEIGFDIPLSYSERLHPYRPPIGHFDPTDPNSPTIMVRDPPGNKPDPNGPVMTDFQVFLLLCGIISPAVIIVLVDVIYIKYYYLEPKKKKEISLLEKSGKDRPLPLLEMFKNSSVG